MTRVLPRNAAEITPDWLTLALRAGGLDGAEVADARLTRIGQEQSFTGGAAFRISLTWRGAGRGPDSLVAKLSPTDPGLAAACFAANCREVAFYDRLAGRGVLPVPRAYFHATDARRNASVILLQDLKDARAVPFAQGFSAVEAGTAVDALAQIHAAFWQDPALAGFDGMALLRAFDFGACWARFPQALRAILGAAALPPSFLALGDWLAANQNRVFGDLYAQGPVTCLHRDLQADNVVFDDAGRAVLFDWQMMGAGRGAADVAYLLISSCAPAIRRSAERDLIARYHRALCGRGVTGYGHVQCWQDYLRGVAGKVLMTVVATVLFDNGSAHKIAWRRTDLDRLLAFCVDHGVGPATFA